MVIIGVQRLYALHNSAIHKGIALPKNKIEKVFKTNLVTDHRIRRLIVDFLTSPLPPSKGE